MPIPVSFSEKDLKRGATVEPAWYLVTINSIGVKPSNDGQSTNYPTEITIVKNADNDSAAFAEVPVDFNYNSKAMGFVKLLLTTLNPELQLKADQKYDLQSAEGQQVEYFIGNKEYNGRILNDVQTGKVRPAGTGAKLRAQSVVA